MGIKLYHTTQGRDFWSESKDFPRSRRANRQWLKFRKQDGCSMRKNWEVQVGVTDDTLGITQCRANFIKGTDHELVTLQRELCVGGHNLMVVDVITPLLRDAEITTSSPYWVVVEGWVPAERKVLAFIRANEREYDEYGTPQMVRLDNSNVNVITVEVTGHRDDIAVILRAVDAAFGNKQFARIKWWYKEGGGGVRYKDLFLPPITTKLLPEFYPSMTDPRAYLDDYLKDVAAILLVAGDPGTGKTTLLRHLICDFKLSAHIVYDEELMKNDSVFQDFLFSKNSDILIIEDADTILTSREDDGNKLMARFLNVSDGLIKLPNKKVVFTTNISDFNRVDQALVRPGRCFDALHTRAMNLPEAQAAARVAGVPIPTERKEYTLAELFNQGRKPVMLRRTGFSR